MSEWLMADHAEPGKTLDQAEAEMVVVTLAAGGDVVMLELQDGTQLVFRGDELRERIAPKREARAA